MFTAKPGPRGTRVMEAFFVAEFFTPGHGMACFRPNMKWRVRGLDDLRICFGRRWESLQLPADGTSLLEQGDLDHWGGRGIGGTTSILTALRTDTRGQKKFVESGGDSIPGNYPFFSAMPVTIPPPSRGRPPVEKFIFSGGTVTLDILTTDTNELVQTCTFDFPEGEFKVPGDSKDMRTRNFWWVNQTMLGADTIVGLEIAGVAGNAPTADPDPTAGDKRMVTGLRDVPATRFRAHMQYKERGIRHVHSFTLTTGPNRIPGNTAAGMFRFWRQHTLSGDKVRERPYVDIYPRVTTRSNSFTIHYKVQVLRKARGTPPDEWDPERDTVIAEQRGATLIERHIAPNDPRLPDFATLQIGPLTGSIRIYRP